MEIIEKIQWAKPSLWGRERELVADAIESSWISGGPYLQTLEKSFADLFEVPFTLATSSGTTALHLAYLALGLKPGDEVLLPGFGFMGAANVALQMQLKPVFAEVDPETWCLSPEALEKKLSTRTKAIVPIHTYGNVCEMDATLAFAKKHRLTVIEDCAEALFSKYKNRYAGTLGDINCFSFHATKTISTGEGGLVVMRDEALFRKSRLFQSHGLLERGQYRHEVPGLNFRLTNLQAAFGCAQFEAKEKIIAARIRLHTAYKKQLETIDGIALQSFSKDVLPVLWALALKLDPKAFPQGVEKVRQQLAVHNIETRPGFCASSLLKIYEPHQLPVCEDLSQNILSLPFHPGLTEEQVQQICRALKALKK